MQVSYHLARLVNTVRSAKSWLLVPVLVVATVSCGGGGTAVDNSSQTDPPSPALVNTLIYDGREFALTHGLEEVFRSSTNHANSELNIANDEFALTVIDVGFRRTEIWRPRDETAWAYFNINSPGPNATIGTSGLKAGTYEWQPDSVDENSTAMIGRSFFFDARLAIDLNGDGQVESADGEFLDVVGGSVNVDIVGPEYVVSFQFELENGRSAQGAFRGDFIQINRALAR